MMEPDSEHEGRLQNKWSKSPTTIRVGTLTCWETGNVAGALRNSPSVIVCLSTSSMKTLIGFVFGS